MKLNLPEGFCHCAFLYSGDAVPLGAANTFALEQNPLITDPADIAGILANSWRTFLNDAYSNDIVLDAVRVKFGPSIDGPFAEVTSGERGTLTGTSGPPQVSYLMKKNTTAGGRGGGGRMYIPGLSEELVSENGHIQSGTVTDLDAAWGSWLESISTSAGTMVLLHAFGTRQASDGSTVTVPAKAPTNVTSLTCDGTVATQRQRLRR